MVPGTEVILYGSGVHGDTGWDSDHERLILADDPMGRRVEDQIGQRLYGIELESGLYRAMPFNQNVEKEGIVL